MLETVAGVSKHESSLARGRMVGSSCQYSERCSPPHQDHEKTYSVRQSDTGRCLQTAGMGRMKKIESWTEVCYTELARKCS